MNSAYLLGLVSDKVRTAHVTFEPGGKSYTYITTLAGLKHGQDVIVEVASCKPPAFPDMKPVKPELKVATVVSVDDGVEVDPESPIKFRWIISDIGSTARAKQEELHKMEDEVLKVLHEAEKKHRRKALSAKIAEAFGDDALKQAQAITAGAGFVPAQENC